MRAALSSYVKGRGVLCCRVGGRPDDLAAIQPSWPILYPNSGGSRVEGRRMVVMSSVGLEGVADVGPYGIQE
jgi:hypothetical protein